MRHATKPRALSGVQRVAGRSDPDRPCDHIPVPADWGREFLDGALPAHDPDLARWEAFFQKTGVAYARAVVEHGRIMLFTHRSTGTHGRRWCCLRRRKTARDRKASATMKRVWRRRRLKAAA